MVQANRKSIRIKIIFYFTVVIVFTSIGLSVVSQAETRQVIVKELIENTGKIAHELDFNVKKLITDHAAALEVLAGNAVIRSDADADKKKEELLKFKKIFPIYEDIILADADGTVIAATDYLFGGKWKYHTAFTEAIKGTAHISQVFMNLTPIRPVIEFGTPVYSAPGQIMGTVGAQINMEKIAEISDHVRIGKTGFAFILDEKRRVIAHPDKERILKDANENLSRQIASGIDELRYEEDGRVFRGSFVGGENRVPEGWVTVIVQEEAEMFHPIRMMILKNTAIGTLLAVVALLLAILLSNSIVNPIAELKRAVSVIETGKLKFRARINSGDEIGDLSDAFSHMTHRLSDLIQIIEKERAKSEALLESLGDGVIACDLKENLILINSQAENLLGLNKDAFEDGRFFETLSIRDEAGNAVTMEHRQIARSMEHGKPAFFKFTAGRSENAHLMMASVAPIMMEKKLIGIVLVFRDYTREQKIEAIKSDFVTIASHQLRTPLNGMKWQFELIMQKGRLDKVQKETLKDAMLSNQRMINLVNDFLLIANIESDQPEINPESVSVMSVINEVANEMKSFAAEKNNKMIVKSFSDFQVKVDPELFRRILYNLISNAAKYNQRNKAIVISVRKKGSKRFEIAVKDGGIGIPKKDMDKLFTKFYRSAESLAYSTTSSGLGLYYAKRAAELCNGSVYAESTLGKGSVFTVELPIEYTK